MIKYYIHTYKYSLLALLALFILAIASLVYLSVGFHAIPEIDVINSLGFNGFQYEQSFDRVLDESRDIEIYFWGIKAIRFAIYSFIALTTVTAILALYISSSHKWTSGTMIIGSKQLAHGLILIITTPLLSYAIALLITTLSLGLYTPLLKPIGVLLILITLLLIVGFKLVTNYSKYKYQNKTKSLVTCLIIYLILITLGIFLLASGYFMTVFIAELFLIIILVGYLSAIANTKLGV